MVIVFGSINLDLIFALPRIPLAGETVLGPSVRIDPGGKGANQAVAAARDGARVILAGAVGRDSLADSALVLLREAGVDLTRVIATDVSTGCASITVDPAGDNAIAVGSGANVLALASQIEDSLLDQNATLLLQMEVPAAETAALIRRARAQGKQVQGGQVQGDRVQGDRVQGDQVQGDQVQGAAGARIILNLAPAAALAEDALRMVDVLVVNETEAAWLAGDLGLANTAASLRDRLGVTVVRTLGGAGMDVATPDAELTSPAFAIVPVDTTAAGDCFMGVLAAALDRGMAMTDALHRAAAAAAVCCTRAGSQGSLPMAADTDAMVARGL